MWIGMVVHSAAGHAVRLHLRLFRHLQCPVGIDPGEGRATFALALFIGLITFGVFSETANAAPSLVLGNANYVKKVVFPLEVLPS